MIGSRLLIIVILAAMGVSFLLALAATGQTSEPQENTLLGYRVTRLESDVASIRNTEIAAVRNTLGWVQTLLIVNLASIIVAMTVFLLTGRRKSSSHAREDSE